MQENFDLIQEINKNKNNAKVVLSLIKKFGKIKYDENLVTFFYSFLNYKNKEVRALIVKNLGKIINAEISSRLKLHFLTEVDSIVKRECISSIGRERNKNNVNFFLAVINDNDPKIVLQVIRSLLVFKKDPLVIEHLHKIIDHPNEMIKEVLEIELNPKDKKIESQKHSDINIRLKNTIVHGDVKEILQYINEESIHLTFTSPPYYNARDYSFYSSYEDYLQFLKEVFKGIHRITKNGRFLIVNTSPVIVPRVSRAHSSKRYPIPFDLNTILVNDGWEFIDDIIWEKPEYTVKNRIGGFMQHRKPLSYKPNTVTEYLMVYRKKSKDLIDWNLKQYSKDIIEESLVEDGYETNNVWKIDPKNDKIHSAIFPKALCERIIKYYSFKNDLVFDPFGGSGTLAEVALNLDRNVFMTEINDEYYQRIQDKLINKKELITYITQNEFKKWISQDQ